MRAVQFRKSALRFIVVKGLGRWMPKLVTSPLGMVTLREVDRLKLPSSHWVRVRPKLCGVCGSDTAVITAKSSLFLSPLISVPFTFGHEIVGEVKEVGENVSKVLPGDRVVIEPALSCFVREIEPPCPRCSEGNYACCERVTEGVISPGIQTGYCKETGGGWSDELVAHQWQLFRVPDGVDDEIAVLTEPFSCALHSVLRVFRYSEVRPGTGLVIGCGTIGLLTIAALRILERIWSKESSASYHSGKEEKYREHQDVLQRTDSPGLEKVRSPMRLIAIAKYPHQREWAIKLGADEVVKADEGVYKQLAELTGAKLFQPELGKPTVLGGFDVVFDCIGSGNSLEDAVRWTRANGVLAVVGMPAEPRVNWTSIWFKELKIIGAYAYGVEDWQGERVRTFEIALNLLEENAKMFEGFVTHKFPLSQWRQAIQTAIQPGKNRAIKVAIYP